MRRIAGKAASMEAFRCRCTASSVAEKPPSRPCTATNPLSPRHAEPAQHVAPPLLVLFREIEDGGTGAPRCGDPVCGGSLVETQEVLAHVLAHEAPARHG